MASIRTIVAALVCWTALQGAVRGQEPVPIGLAGGVVDEAVRPAQAPAATLPPASQPAAAPTSPLTPSPLAAAAPPTTAAAVPPTFARRAGTFGTLAGLSGGSQPVMIGDLGPLSQIQRVGINATRLPPPFPPPTSPPPPAANRSTMLYPTLRVLKISENQSPRPQDRIFYSFNFFDGVNDSINTRLNSPTNNMRVFRHIFGVEKTFNDARDSVGLRLPLNTISADSRLFDPLGQFGGTSTSLGDLNIFFKHIVLENQETGSLLSGGLAVTAPTGPASFAGSDFFTSTFHSTTLQPFIGYILSAGRLYFHGFSAIDVPTDSRDVTLLFNDVGVGYFLKRVDPAEGDVVNLIAPTFEVHVNTPLNHRGSEDPFDLAATWDVVNLTYGLNVGLFQNTLLTFGFVTPVTGPQPFDFEVLALLNIRFGDRARGPQQVPPVVGGF
jgi:hypothetical protein